MEPIMDESIDGDHPGSCLDPLGPLGIGAQQKGGQAHAQHFWANAFDMPHRAHDRPGEHICGQHLLQSAGPKLVIDPAHKIAHAHIPHEQSQAISRPVQAPIAQVMAGQGTVRLVQGLGTFIFAFAIPAAMEAVIARELGTRRLALQLFADLVRGDPLMILDKAIGGGITDALKRDRVHQPIEDCRVASFADRLDHTGSSQFHAGVVNQAFASGDLADIRDKGDDALG